MAVTSYAPRANAPRSARPRLFWSRLHFAIRLLGLSGALLACVCAVLAGVRRELDPLYAAANVREAADVGLHLGQTAVEEPRTHLVLLLLLAGAAAALLALLIESLVIVAFTATRRSAFGFNALVQGALAAVLLIGVNVWSFRHYQRVDCTRDRQYTLPASDRDNLAQLDPQSKTTVIVYQLHKTFGTLTGKPDRFDYAAERKVVEKVFDLADQLAEVGPQLNVAVLDVEEDGYEDRLAALTRDAPELRKAIDSAPENSLFFFARGEDGRENIQRLSFNDFYLLDKTASQEADGGRRNLVLLAQGSQPFVRRILSLGGRKPRIGIAVIHDVLTSTGEDEWGLQGLRKALEEHGFEVRDILLKRWTNFAPPEAAAYTADENTLDELEQEERLLKGVVAALTQDQKTIGKALDIWRKAVKDAKTRDELTRRFAAQLRGNKISAEMARDQVEELQYELKFRDAAVERGQEQLKDIDKKKSKLNVPALTEQRRMTDLKAKMDRLLADCDVLFVPRMTLRNTAATSNIPASLYRMEKAQADSIKDFLKAGKPLLACLGPSNEEPERRMAEPNRPEPLETLLSELGIKLGKQTVLFDVEMKAFAERRAGKTFAGNTVRVPSVLFDWKPGLGHPLGYPVLSRQENPIRHSLRLATRGLGQGQALDIVLRLPRPVYYEPPTGIKPDFDADFLMSDADSWNEDQPFPTADSIPQFTRPKDSADAAKALANADPLEARRRGPFPIGVAIQTALPASWYASPADKPATVRLTVIGQGGFFTGKNLPPAQEKLFVNTLSWLLGRDDQLPRDDRVWSYPRVNDTIAPDSPTEYLWLWGVRLGLPALFLYLGLVVLLFRRLR